MTILLQSCKSEEIKYYDLSFKNNYFEVIDSIKFDKDMIRVPVYIQKCYEYENKITKGIYNISFYTKSNLTISGQLEVAGGNSQISVAILSDGNIVVE